MHHAHRAAEKQKVCTRTRISINRPPLWGLPDRRTHRTSYSTEIVEETRIFLKPHGTKLSSVLAAQSGLLLPQHAWIYSITLWRSVRGIDDRLCHDCAIR